MNNKSIKLTLLVIAVIIFCLLVQFVAVAMVVYMFFMMKI